MEALPLYLTTAREAGRCLCRALNLPRKKDRAYNGMHYLRLHYSAHAERYRTTGVDSDVARAARGAA